MPTPRLIQCRDFVHADVVYIHSSMPSPPFGAIDGETAAVLQPTLRTENFEGFDVQTYGRQLLAEPFSRERFQEQFQIDVTVQARRDDPLGATPELVLADAEFIARYLRRRQYGSGNDKAVCVRAEVPIVFDRAAWDQYNLALCIVQARLVWTGPDS